MSDPKITVFTPTYNRAHTLGRLYESLRNQSSKNFEWLIIDDGSGDNTGNLVKQWLKEANLFKIRYYYKDNGGKHTAINYGLDKAKGELFFTADSDDFLTSDAMQKVEEWVKLLPENKKFCGIAGNWGYSQTETPNTIFNSEWRDINLLERYGEFSVAPVDGERAWVFFTEIHKKYKYPEFHDEKFITEAVAWNRMANDGYNMRVFNDIIYIYKFLPGGLTLSGSKIFIENPKGFGLWLKEKAHFLKYNRVKKIKMYYSYLCSQISRLTAKEIAANIGTNRGVILMLSLLYFMKSFLNQLRSKN